MMIHFGDQQISRTEIPGTILFPYSKYGTISPVSNHQVLMTQGRGDKGARTLYLGTEYRRVVSSSFRPLYFG
jgi:hypothetical protein